MDGCSEVIAAATLPAPTQRYALPIPRLSPSSLMSSAYLIVRDPGHYRVASLSRGSHVTNGQRMVAVVATVDSVSDRGAGWKSSNEDSTCRRWQWCRHAGWKPVPRGTLAAWHNAAWHVGYA